MFSCEFCRISKNTFSYKTPPVAASLIIRKSVIKSSIQVIASYTNLLQEVVINLDTNSIKVFSILLLETWGRACTLYEKG